MRSSGGRPDLNLGGKRAFLFDLDGVFLKGKEEPVKIGGTRILEALRKRGKRVFLLTNNSTDTVEVVHERLVNAGIGFELGEILTSTRLTAEYVAKKYPGSTYYLIGEEGFEEELSRLGLRRTTDGEAEVVVVGLDRKLTYDKLDRAVRVARNGADIVATHSARLYMYKHGPAIAVGPILKAVEYGAGKEGTTIGKPSPLMFRLALERSGCTSDEAVMVGDQEDTDVTGASAAGIDSVLVLTGFEDGRKPSGALMKVGNVDDLVDFL